MCESKFVQSQHHSAEIAEILSHTFFTKSESNGFTKEITK